MAETAVTFPLPEHYVQAYTTNVRAILQRNGGKLIPYVTHGHYQGDKVQVVNFIGTIDFNDRTQRFGDTTTQDAEHTQVWLYGTDRDAAVLVEKTDMLRTIYDPSNMYVDAMRRGAARKQDDTIKDAFFGSMATGIRGATSTAFGTTANVNYIAHSSTGLTVTKLRWARLRLAANYVDLDVEQPMIGVTQQQVDNLLGDTNVTSADFNTVKALTTGEVDSYMGFKFVKAEAGLPKTSTTRRCPVWVMSGMHFGDWQNLSIQISPRPDKKNIPQIFAEFTCGATRLEDGKVLEVQCTET